jgi:hypothetical protein
MPFAVFLFGLVPAQAPEFFGQVADFRRVAHISRGQRHPQSFDRLFFRIVHIRTLSHPMGLRKENSIV